MLKDTVTQGAYVEVSVKYGLITLIRETLDLCDHVKEVDLECPIEKGKLTLTKVVKIPPQIPPVSFPPPYLIEYAHSFWFLSLTINILGEIHRQS